MTSGSTGPSKEKLPINGYYSTSTASSSFSGSIISGSQSGRSYIVSSYSGGSMASSLAQETIPSYMVPKKSKSYGVSVVSLNKVCQEGAEARTEIKQLLTHLTNLYKEQLDHSDLSIKAARSILDKFEREFFSGGNSLTNKQKSCGYNRQLNQVFRFLIEKINSFILNNKVDLSSIEAFFKDSPKDENSPSNIGFYKNFEELLGVLKGGSPIKGELKMRVDKLQLLLKQYFFEMIAQYHDDLKNCVSLAGNIDSSVISAIAKIRKAIQDLRIENIQLQMSLIEKKDVKITDHSFLAGTLISKRRNLLEEKSVLSEAEIDWVLHFSQKKQAKKKDQTDENKQQFEVVDQTVHHIFRDMGGKYLEIVISDDCSVPLVQKKRFVAAKNRHLGHGGFKEVFRSSCYVVKNCAVKKLPDSVWKEARNEKAAKGMAKAQFELRDFMGVEGLAMPWLTVQGRSGNKCISFESLFKADLDSVYKRLNWEQKVYVALAISGKLAFLHDTGYVHRDIKLENIFVDGIGGIHIADLDTSKKLINGKHQGYMGTAGYIPPEMWKGKKSLTLKTDIYSLGVTVYKLFVDDAKDIKDMQNYQGAYKVAKSSDLSYYGQLVDNRYEKDAFAISEKHSDKIGFDVIQKIIKDATHIDPEERPTAAQIVTRIQNIIGLNQNPLMSNIFEEDNSEQTILGVQDSTDSSSIFSGHPWRTLESPQNVEDFGSVVDNQFGLQGEKREGLKNVMPSSDESASEDYDTVEHVVPLVVRSGDFSDESVDERLDSVEVHLVEPQPFRKVNNALLEQPFDEDESEDEHYQPPRLEVGDFNYQNLVLSSEESDSDSDSSEDWGSVVEPRGRSRNR